MATSKGYYSLVQFCPDPSRAEAANVGVLLLCPEAGFISARVSRSNGRIAQFFGRGSYDKDLVNAAKQALLNRLELERGSLQTVADLQRFIRTRANDLLLTPPRPMKVFDAEADLDRLFSELVGGRSARPSPTAEPEIPELDRRLREPTFRGRVKFGHEVEVPIVRRRLRVPYAFQNGVLNLLKPQRFARIETAATDVAMKLAIEGDLLQRHAEAGIKHRLIVVSRFDDPDAGFVPHVRDLFANYGVQCTPSQQVDDLVRFVDREARPVYGAEVTAAQ